jgi:hypothetical protein
MSQPENAARDKGRQGSPVGATLGVRALMSRTYCAEPERMWSAFLGR